MLFIAICFNRNFILGHWLSREILTKYELKNSFRNQFIKKRLALRKPGRRLGCLMSCLILCLLVILTYNEEGNRKLNPFHTLEHQQKQEFFTNDCLSIIEEIRGECLKQHLSASAILHLKCKNHRRFSGFCCCSLVIFISILGLPITHAHSAINQLGKDYPATNVDFGCIKDVIKSQI